MRMNLYLDFHVLQTVPPSCVNRDDTGSPKTAVYGGVTRARVSSQAWKREMRLMFRDLLKPEQCGIRTKHLPEELSKRISALDPAAKADDLAKALLNLLGIGVDSKDEKKTKVLLFVSPKQLDAMAKFALDNGGNAKALKKDKALKEDCIKVLNANPSVDIALFGRMLAEAADLNYDAAAQVAHSISTHAVHNEYDYFTAMDDCSPEDNKVAGHLGTVEFNSSTLYRYATVSVRELAGYLGADTPAAVRCFAEAFILSMPTGKQHTFANRTLPDFVYVTVRRDQPVNLCGAFEKPIPAGKGGYVEPSVATLVKYAVEKVYRPFDLAPETAWAVGGYPVQDGFAKAVLLPALFSEVEGFVKAALDSGVI